MRSSELGVLLASSSLASLEALSLKLSLDTRTFNEVLAHDVAATRLSRLDLSGNRFGDDGFSSLLRSELLERIVELQLRSTGLTDYAVRELVRHPFPHLERLWIGWNQLTPGAIELLAGWEGAPKLTELAFHGLFGGSEREALLASPHRKALRTVLVRDP